jgi:hypothetical protein
MYPLDRWYTARQRARSKRGRGGKQKVSNIRRLVLDVLKPYEPSIVDLARQLSNIEGVDGVNINIYEIDRKVENAKVIIQGKDIIYDEILKVIQDNGGAVHSIDEAVAGNIILDDVPTLQD